MNQVDINSEISAQVLKKRNLPCWLIGLINDNLIIGIVVIVYIIMSVIVDTFYYNNKLVNINIGFHWFDRYILYFLLSYFFIYLFIKNVDAKKNKSTIIDVANDFKTNYLSVERLIGFYLTYSLLNPFFSAFSSIKSHIPLFNYYYADKMLMKIDQFLHFGYHPWELLQPILGLPILTQFLDLLYSIWFFLLFGICTWMAISRFRRLRLQFFISFFMTWIILGNIMAIVLSSVGPCYYGGLLAIPSG